MMFMPSLMKICALVQKLLAGQAHGHDYNISLLFSCKIRNTDQKWNSTDMTKNIQGELQFCITHIGCILLRCKSDKIVLVHTSY